jgi:hypothetical protein
VFAGAGVERCDAGMAGELSRRHNRYRWHVAGPFDMKTAPFAGGFFVGDYEGLATIGSTFVPLFVQANTGNTANRTDVFETTASP